MVEKTTTQEVFETIYRDKLWGGRKRFWQRFYSGTGSHDDTITEPYIAAVKPLISNKNVVDVGCGDFSVGSRLYKSARNYIGFDVVRPLIEHNLRKFDADFRVLDAIEDDLPDADVVLVRQVLQHLNNEQVAKILPKLRNYKIAVVTEHVPGFPGFVPNLDKKIGADHRVSFGSGLVLTEPPFNLSVNASRVLCDVPERFGGIIRTIVFEF